MATKADHDAQCPKRFMEMGATHIVEAWQDNVKDGIVTGFPRAILAKEGKRIVFSWIAWPDKATCEIAYEKMM